MTSVIKFKPRNSVGVPNWVLTLANRALRDEFNAIDEKDEDTLRFRIVSDEIGRREDTGAWKTKDWTDGSTP